jgi:arylsulfatase A-like enzyme
MFTGVHPGEHKYVGVGEASDHPIHPDLVTLPELLASQGYKCSGLASHARILPEGGFGRGFYRYRSQNMTEWLDRRSDARTAVNQVLQWVEQDKLSSPSSDKVFYFLHVFDPHQPYIPDHPTAAVEDFSLAPIDTFGKVDFEKQLSVDNVNGVDLNDELVEKIRSCYTASVEYTARQLYRLIEGLKRNDLFDNALIIVTGDHGEMFGENGMYKHKSVHYTNIRPFMAIKPPADADWTVPDTPSTIDILPTIATSVGAEIPNQCQGIPWQRMKQERSVRITERIRPDAYNIAIESNGIMAIFTYQERYPERPGQSELEAGPINEEFYQVNDLRVGRFIECEEELQASIKKQMRSQAKEFVSADPILKRDKQRSVQASEETDEQLRHLGYK